MKKISFLVLLIIAFFASDKIYALEQVMLSKCVDGDTAAFIINDKIVKVRFLAIDTPETVHTTKEVELYGADASEFTCSSLTNSTLIELEYDPESDRYDKYDRLLAWVYVDGKLLQDELVKIGYAEVKYIYGDYLYTDILYDSQNKAKDEKLGIWSEYKEEGNIWIYIFVIVIVLLYTCCRNKNTKGILKKIYKKLLKVKK